MAYWDLLPSPNLPAFRNRTRLASPPMQQVPNITAGVPTAFPIPDMQTPAMDAFRSHVGSYPEYETPGKWRRLAAALTGVGVGWRDPMQGIAAAQYVRDEPFNRRLEDWSNRGEGLRQAANIESMNLGRENSAVRNQNTFTLGLGRIDIQKEQNRIAWDRNQIDRQELDVRREQMESMGWITREVESPDGSYVAIVALNPRTGQKFDVGVSPKLTSKETIEEKRKDRAIPFGLQEDRQQFMIDNPQFYERDQGADTGNVPPALLTYDDQAALSKVAAKNPGWVSKWIYQHPVTMKLQIRYPDADTDPAEQADFQQFMSELQRYKTVTPKASAPRAPRPTSAAPARSSGAGTTMTLKDGTVVTVR